MRCQITFRSGAQIEVDLNDDLLLGRDDGVTTIRWSTPEVWERKLCYLPDPHHIESVVALADPETTVAQ